jgi:TonB family protein
MYTYLLQSSSCLIVLYGIYHFILADLTFFRHNRAYLLWALVISLLVPLMAPYLVLPQEQVPVINWSYVAMEMDTIYVTYSDKMDYLDMLWMFAGFMYFLGVLVVLSRMIYGIFKIIKYHHLGVRETKNGYNIVTTEGVHLPFSFFKSIYISRHIPLSDHLHTILEHEEIHIRHWHTVDVLFAEVVHAFFWFNPVMIFYKRALRQAHEYLADDIICSKNSVSSYVDLLLSKSESGLELALTNQFFHSQIKKRIEMMTKHKTNRHAAWKYALVLPLLMGLVVVFSSPEVKSDIINVFKETTDTIPSAQRASIDEVQTLSVKNETLRITLKNGEVESYDLSDGKETEMFKEKYGELALPQPSPPLLHGNALLTEDVESIEQEKDYIKVTHRNGVSKYFYRSVEQDMKTYKNFYGEIPISPSPQVLPAIQIISKPTTDPFFQSIPNPPSPPSSVNDVSPIGNITTRRPLFVIDGVNMGREADKNINPGDIKSISVLKGESATTLYGEDGKYGVILITTKASKKDKGEIFRVAEQMPRFPGCEDQPAGHERDDCAKTKMLEYIYQNLKYPQEARKNNVEGQVVLQFVVEKDGRLNDIKVVRDIGAGCGIAASQVIESMNAMKSRWIPGKQSGKNVSVLYTLPVKFKLEGTKSISPSENKPIVNYFETNVNWKECADLGGFFKSTMCSFGKTNDFVKLHLTYPNEARKNKIEGSCQVRAYYDESGKLTKAEIKEDIGYGCGDEVLRVVKLMPEMAPAQKDGKPIKGSLIIRATFKLTKDEEKKLAATKIIVTALGKEEKKVNSTIPFIVKSTKYSEAISEVDQLPWLDACAHISDIKDRKKCAENKFLSTLYSNIKYPKAAREKGVTGMVHAQFVVNKKGEIDDIKILSDIGFGTDEIVVKAIEKLKNSDSWIPGRKNGKEVDVLYQISVNFELEVDFRKVVSMNSLDSKLSNVKIFPNPSQDLIQVSFEGEPMDVEINLFDVSGKSLKTQKFSNDQTQFRGSIDISDLNIKGNVTVIINQNNKMVRQQIVVLK